MIKRWVLVKSGVVENIVLAEDDFAQGYLTDNYDHVEHFEDQDLEPRIGWVYVAGQYHEPNWNAPEEPPVVPQPEGGQ